MKTTTRATLRPLAAAFFILQFALFISAARAQQVTRLDLSTPATAWEFRQQNLGDWLPATVPGMIHTDLLANKKISDPFYADNWLNLQWIDKLNWEYRATFDAPRATTDDNARLVFNGLDTYATVWLNGQKILEADNFHRTWKVDLAKNLLKSKGNELHIIFCSPTVCGLEALTKFSLKLEGSGDWSTYGGIGDNKLMFFTRKPGAQYGWNISPRLLTSGIWRPVVLESWNDARIEDFYAYTKTLDFAHATPAATATAQKAVVGVSLTINATKPGPYAITLTLNGAPAKQFTRTLQAGQNTIEETFDVLSPRLWWPNGAGEPFLYDITATLVQILAQVGSPSDIEYVAVVDTRSHKLGIRTTELVRTPDPDGKGCSFGIKINGLPIFCKGANWVPLDTILARVTPEKREYLIRSAAAVHMNMLREWGGGAYEDDQFYELCDRYGIMVWQDYMFACGMYPDNPEFFANVKAEVADNLRRLRNHPSVVLWCGNNEIEVGWNPYGSTFDPPRLQKYYPKQTDRDRITKAYETLFYEILPAETRAAYADNMPYWHSSPSPGPKLGVADPYRQGDYHYWKTWHAMKPISDYNLRVGRFISEYGIQSFPELSSLKRCIPENELTLHSPAIEAHQSDHKTGAPPHGNDRILAYVAEDYRVPETFAHQVYISQLMQANAMRTAMEAHRRAKPWCQGSLVWQLDDLWPCVTKALIDYYGHWKAAHYWMSQSCDDILISPYQHDGTLDLYIVSDRYTPLEGTLTLTLLDFTGKKLKTQTLPVTLPANSSTKVTTCNAADFLAGQPANNAVLVCEFKSAVGASLATPARTYEALHYFNKVKDLALPKPNITFAVTLNADSVPVIKVTTDVLAKNVMVALDGEAGIFTDNFFDLLPGETREITLMPDTPTKPAPAKPRTAADIKSALTALSVGETY